MKNKAKMNLTFVVSYHNNMHDSLRILQEIANVIVLSPRPLEKPIYNTEGIEVRIQPQWNILKRFHTWKLRSLWNAQRESSHVIVKDILGRNIIPICFAIAQKSKIIILVQQMPNQPKLVVLGIRTFLAIVNTWTNITYVSNTKKSYQNLLTLGQQSEYIPACIDPSKFILATPGKTTKTLSIITVSKYQARKNLNSLLEATAQLRNKYSDIAFKLTIIGSKTTDDKYASIYHHISTLKLNDIVTLHTEIPYSDMPEHYAQADIFIFPASQEPLGYALLEAMASGLPVIITNEIGARHYIQERKNGFICKPKSVPSLVQAIEQFIHQNCIDTKKLKKFGNKSRELIDKYHTPKTWLKHIKPLL